MKSKPKTVVTNPTRLAIGESYLIHIWGELIYIVFTHFKEKYYTAAGSSIKKWGESFSATHESVLEMVTLKLSLLKHSEQYFFKNQVSKRIGFEVKNISVCSILCAKRTLLQNDELYQISHWNNKKHS